MKLPKSSLMLLLATGQFVFDIFRAGLSSPAGMMMSGTHTVRDDIICDEGQVPCRICFAVIHLKILLDL